MPLWEGKPVLSRSGQLIVHGYVFHGIVDIVDELSVSRQESVICVPHEEVIIALSVWLAPLLFLCYGKLLEGSSGHRTPFSTLASAWVQMAIENTEFASIKVELQHLSPFVPNHVHNSQFYGVGLWRVKTHHVLFVNRAHDEHLPSINVGHSIVIRTQISIKGFHLLFPRFHLTLLRAPYDHVVLVRLGNHNCKVLVLGRPRHIPRLYEDFQLNIVVRLPRLMELLHELHHLVGALELEYPRCFFVAEFHVDLVIVFGVADTC